MKCKFCGKYDTDDQSVNASAFIRYGKRGASAHLRCLAVGKGADFILSLPTFLLKQLPYMQVRELGFENALRDKLAERAHYSPFAAASWDTRNREKVVVNG